MTDKLFPLSVEQCDYYSPDREGYSAIPAVSAVTGWLDEAALTEAVATVVSRHEPLRMRLARTDDGMRQLFLPSAEAPTSFLHDRVVGVDDLHRFTVRELDLEHEGSIRLHLLRESDKRTYVLVMLDHLACDGWSTFLFLREMWQAYRSYVTGAKPDLPDIHQSYSRYVLDQNARARRRGPVVREHWRAVADRFAHSATGLGALVSQSDGRGRADLAIPLTHDQVARANRAAKLAQVTRNTVPLACLIMAAWSLSGAESVGVNFVYSGRDLRSLRSMIGVLARRIPLVIEGFRDNTVTAVLRQVSQAVVEGIQYSRAPFSAREFETTVRRARSSPTVELLYNQVDSAFGERIWGEPRMVSDDATVNFVDNHYDPRRWRNYCGPQMHVVLSGQEQPILQAIFNERDVEETAVLALLERTAAILQVIDITVEQKITTSVSAAKLL